MLLLAIGLLLSGVPLLTWCLVLTAVHADSQCRHFIAATSDRETELARFSSRAV